PAPTTSSASPATARTGPAPRSRRAVPTPSAAADPLLLLPEHEEEDDDEQQPQQDPQPQPVVLGRLNRNFHRKRALVGHRDLIEVRPDLIGTRRLQLMFPALEIAVVGQEQP